MTEANTLAAHIGAQVRVLRNSAQQTQDQLATRLGWQQSHVATLEAGRRSSLSLDDLAVLCSELGVTLTDLLAGDGSVTLTRKGSRSTPARLPALRHVLLGEPMPKAGGLRGEVALAMATGDAERKAGRKLGVPAESVTAAAMRRWGHSLTSERTRREKARAHPGASPQSIQALRGHITRELLTELAPDLGRSHA